MLILHTWPLLCYTFYRMYKACLLFEELCAHNHESTALQVWDSKRSCSCKQVICYNKFIDCSLPSTFSWAAKHLSPKHTYSIALSDINGAYKAILACYAAHSKHLGVAQPRNLAYYITAGCRCYSFTSFVKHVYKTRLNTVQLYWFHTVLRLVDQQREVRVTAISI